MTEQCPHKPIVIFDLDGTLALVEHRRHFLENPMDPERWTKFYQACVDDLPNHPVILMLQVLVSSGADVRIWSGRSDEMYHQTIEWLYDHVGLGRAHSARILKMRRQDDFTPDDQLKERWLDQLPASERERVAAIYDDRDKVVKMWRRRGLTCFQVAPGAF